MKYEDRIESIIRLTTLTQAESEIIKLSIKYIGDKKIEKVLIEVQNAINDLKPVDYGLVDGISPETEGLD